MGETKEEVKATETKPEDKKEEKVEEKKEEKKEEKAEEKKEEAKASPPSPTVLFVDLHCVGCAKKIARSILKCRGVEEVETDLERNEVKVKGIVDPQALCSRIQKKTLRSAKVLSPLPPPDAADSATEVPISSQVSGMTTVELHVNMHCEACAQQLRKKILKMRGVQAAETDLSSGKVNVTGTMSGEKLVHYIYRRTGKVATVIPPPPPPPPKEEEKKEDTEKKAEEAKPAEEEKKEEKAEEKKEENAEKKEEKPENAAEANKDGSNEAEKGGSEEPKKEGELIQINNNIMTPEDMMRRMMYWNGGYMGEEDVAKRMMPVPWGMPVYVVERPPPPPQLFSDENPNACCIS